MAVDIREPIVTKLANGVYFSWKNQGITATATRIKRFSDSRQMCQLEVNTTLPTYPEQLYFGDYSLLSITHRRDLERILKARCDQLDWLEVLQQISSRIVKTYQRGEPVIEISSNDDVPDLQYLIEPYLPQGQPTVLYGDGGTFKSYLALMLAISARLPWINNTLDITVPPEPVEVLYLDWETTKNEVTRRLKRICTAHELQEVNIRYRRCYEPLTDEIDELIDFGRNAGLIIVDSIGAACAGDLNGSDIPTRFFNALRKFNATSLCIYHSNKEKEMFGSRFFWNYARNIYEIRKVQSYGDSFINIGLIHQKFNEGPLSQPRALTIDFTDTGTQFAKQDIENISELFSPDQAARKMTHKDLIKFALQAGSMPVSEIASDTGIKESSIRTVFTRYPDTFEKEGEFWRLKENTT